VSRHLMELGVEVHDASLAAQSVIGVDPSEWDEGDVAWALDQGLAVIRSVEGYAAEISPADEARAILEERRQREPDQ